MLDYQQERLRGTQNLDAREAERAAELCATSESLKKVLYHVAHDLRAPLRTMEGFSSLLIQNYGSAFDETGRDYAQRIASAATRLDCLIRDLLEYGRISHAEVGTCEFNLEVCLEDALAQLAPEIKTKSAEVRADAPLPSVCTCPKMLELVFHHLLDNALKFVAPGAVPRIHIGAEQEGKTVRVWIKDRGIGIDPIYFDKIFRIFERLHPDERYSGTGIGLALVAKAVERMKGRIEVHSRRGEGSRFWLELPAARNG